MASVTFTSSPLYKALISVDSGTPSLVTGLLDSDQVDPSLRGEYGETYLHLLVGNFDANQVPMMVNIIYQLVDAGVEVNAVDKVNNSPLHVAAINKLHPNILNAFIKIGGNPRLRNTEGLDVLDLCRQTKGLKTLLEWYYPGLAESVRIKDTKAVKRCLDGWCTLQEISDMKCITSPVDDGAELEIRGYLKKNRNTNALVHSVISGDVERTIQVLEKTVDVNIKDPTFSTSQEGTFLGCPLLAYAIYTRVYDTAKALIKKSRYIDVDIQMGIKGMNSVPLFYHVLFHFDVIPGDVYRYIIKKATLDLVAKNQFEVMFRCWELGHGPEVLYEFVQRGWMPFICDEHGYWLRERILEKSLPQSRATIKRSLFWIDAIVIEMAASGDTEQLKKLMMRGYEYLNITTPRGISVHEVAASAGHRETADLLRKSQDFLGRHRQLQASIQRGHLPEVRALCSDTQLESCDRTGRSPLITAVIFDRKFIVSYLLQARKDLVKMTDRFGRTALHYACALDQGVGIEKQLLDAGIDPNVKDERGKPAGEYREAALSSFIKSERSRGTGENLFLLDAYLQILNAIDTGNLDKVHRARGSVIGYSLRHVENIVCTSFSQMNCSSFLWEALDAGEEEVGLFLLKEGAGVTQTREMEGSTLTLEDAARRHSFMKLEAGIRAQLA